MCYSVIVGKRASATGSVLMAANDDWPGCPGRVLHVPAAKHSADEHFMTVKGVPIPQAAETFGYTYSACDYETGTRSVSWADGVNDRKVAVAMQGVYAFHKAQKEGDLLECDDIVILMLERGKTAREAILTAGELIAAHGYSTSSIEGAEGTACIAVADAEEGFFLELGPGGYWCARRVADDEIECRPNCFGIGEVDFDDPVRFLCSPGLWELAERLGVKMGDKLNFAKTFGGDTTMLNPGYGGAMNPVNTMRKWNTLHFLGGLNLMPEEQRYSCPPTQRVTVRQLMDLMRDTMGGTEHDLAAVSEAGIHHNPFWMEISTSVAQGGTVICMLVDFSTPLPEALGCLVWWALGNVRCQRQ